MKRLYCFLIAAAGAAATCCLLAFAAPARPAPEVLRGDLRAILARAEFRQVHNQWFYELLTRVAHRISDWWRDHVGNRLDGLVEHAPLLYWTIVALVALLALALIYHIYLTMRSAFGPGRRRGKRRETARSAPLQSEPQALLEQAEAAATAGRFSEALRYLYLALIHQLDRREVVRYDISHTNQEYVRQARRYPVIVAPLRDVSRLADRAWYGQHALGWSEYERCRELVQAAWQEAEHAAAL